DGSNNIISTSNEVISNVTSYTQATNLSQNVVYSVQVKAADAYGYSSFSTKKYFKIILNHPPTGNLSFATPIYQHDTPMFTITQSDPDNDALNIKVESSFNGGGYITIQQWINVASGTSKIFNYGPLSQGTYTLRLTLDDGKGGTYVQTYPFTSLPLGIIGYVNHTADWEAYRQQWNLAHPSNVHAVNEFWAGEAFELTSSVTNTSTSSTKPQSVTATLVETGDAATLVSTDNINFKGEILNTNFIHLLTDGPYTMKFQIYWTNGMIQTYDVPVQIKGNIYDVMRVQMRN
ncbi:MAG: hypothetical protein JWM44_4041, partial [Bacilli bacterium]|nr:hypothetical protein [Bacilli bacterium]